jgi:hypothetical protein
MAPSTHSTAHPSTLTRSSRPSKYYTIKKVRFFNAYDASNPRVSLRAITSTYAPSQRTTRRWLEERTQLGSPGLRRTRKLSKNLGPRPKVLAETCKMLVSPSQNPVHDQLYEVQIKHHHLNVKPRTLQRRLK